MISFDYIVLLTKPPRHRCTCFDCPGSARHLDGDDVDDDSDDDDADADADGDDAAAASASVCIRSNLVSSS